MIYINRVITSLELQNEISEIFDKLNDEYFNNELPKPTIFISPSNKDYSRFNHQAIVVYDRSSTNQYELDISTNLLSLPIENFCAAILHEMCHQFNFMNGIKDTSRGETYHNIRFKRTAEKHGLNVIRSEKYGYSITTPNKELVEWCNREFGKKSIGLFRYEDKSEESKNTRRTHNYRYECPGCHSVVRSGKPVFVICGECGYTMER